MIKNIGQKFITSSFLWYYLRNLFAYLENKIFFFSELSISI